MQLIYVIMGFTNLAIVLALPFLIGLFHLSPEAAHYTRQIVIYHSICCATFWQPSFSLPHALRAAGDVRYTMVVSLFSMWFFRILFSYILGRFFHMGVFGVWVAMTIDWAFRAIMFVIRYRSDKWEYQAV
jgi:Na+-driven multidrug efflux pump